MMMIIIDYADDDQDADDSHKFDAEGRQQGRGFWGRGQRVPPHQPWGLGERCKPPQRGSRMAEPRPQMYRHYIGRTKNP